MPQQKTHRTSPASASDRDGASDVGNGRVASQQAVKQTVLSHMAIATVVTLAVALFYWLFKFDGNITGFFRIGDVFPFSPYLDPAQIKIYPDQLGYDGQLFLTISLDPSLSNPDSIAALDGPGYRYQRILYPLLGYLLGLGQPALIPYALVAINIACLVGLVGLISWAFNSGAPKQSNWRPLLTLCIPGLWMILGFSTADLLSSFLLITAFCCYHRKKVGPTAGAIALACLTRETMAIGWFALFVDSLRRKNWPQVGALLVAICPMLAWRQYVTYSLEQAPNSTGFSNSFVFPFTGIIGKLASLIQGGLETNNLFEAYAFLLLMAVFALLLWTARRSRYTFAIWLAGLLYSLLVISSSSAILEYFLGYSRVYVDAFLLLLLSWGLNSANLASQASQTVPARFLQPQGLLLATGILPSLAFILLSN